MSNKYGIHLPNGSIKHLDKLTELGGSHFTLLHHQANYVGKLREASPDGVILVRFFLENWAFTDPVIWAQTCQQEYFKDRGGWSIASLGCHITPANEQNLELEGGGWTEDWYKRINAWNLAWLQEFRRLTGIPVAHAHFPAFAYGHSDDNNDLGYVGMEICRPAIEAYGILDVHPYWFQQEQIHNEWHGHRFILSHKLFPDKPIFCSETGNFAVMRETTPEEIIQWFESLYEFPYVIGGTPFIFEDPTGAHQQNDWSRNWAIQERVAAQPKKQVSTIIPSNGGSMAFEFTLGFKGFAEAHPEVGQPISDLMYDANGTAVQYTEYGMLHWVKASNTVLFFRASQS